VVSNYNLRAAIGKRITPHESKKTLPGNHHYCFVDFDTKEEASLAVEKLNGKEIPGGQLKVSVSERVSQKPGGRQLDAREGRRVTDRANNTRPNKPETNNAMVSNNWRRKD
jgi:RNA recognition motif-containing protein